MKGRFAIESMLILLIGALLQFGLPNQAMAQSPRFCRVHSAVAAFEARIVGRGEPPVSAPRGVTLLTSRPDVSPGDWIYARLANFGTEVAGYEREFAIERMTMRGWEVDPSSPMGPWFKVLGKLNPGTAGRCYAFQIPLEQADGRYRFSTKIRLPISGQGQPRRVAKFSIGS
jgi:hypothetical protein